MEMAWGSEAATPFRRWRLVAAHDPQGCYKHSLVVFCLARVSAPWTTSAMRSERAPVNSCPPAENEARIAATTFGISLRRGVIAGRDRQCSSLSAVKRCIPRMAFEIRISVSGAITLCPNRISSRISRSTRSKTAASHVPPYGLVSMQESFHAAILRAALLANCSMRVSSAVSGGLPPAANCLRLFSTSRWMSITEWHDGAERGETPPMFLSLCSALKKCAVFAASVMRWLNSPEQASRRPSWPRRCLMSDSHVLISPSSMTRNFLSCSSIEAKASSTRS